MYMWFFFWAYIDHNLTTSIFKKTCQKTSKLLYNQNDSDCWILVGDDNITSKYSDGNPYCIDTNHNF